MLASKSLLMFPQAAKSALSNSQLRRNLGKATTTIRNRRTSVEGELPDWEALRAAGSIIEAHDMRYLDYFLLQLEASVPRAGGSRIHEERAPIRIGIGRVLAWEPPAVTVV